MGAGALASREITPCNARDARPSCEPRRRSRALAGARCGTREAWPGRARRRASADAGDQRSLVQESVVYCLSVGTFMDADGDGIGDFAGLMRRLEYLHGLGITAIWLMPFQTSPGRDDGYDVSDYYGVNPAYGTLGDFVEFTHAAKQRGIRVIIDLVLNHTSDQHPWFQEARRDPTGTSGPTRGRAGRTGAWCSPACRSRPGPTTRRRAPGTSTASTSSSPISTRPIRTSRPRSSRSWGSGSSWGSPDSGWTPCRS